MAAGQNCIFFSKIPSRSLKGVQDGHRLWMGQVDGKIDDIDGYRPDRAADGYHTGNYLKYFHI